MLKSIVFDLEFFESLGLKANIYKYLKNCKRKFFD